MDYLQLLLPQHNPAELYALVFLLGSLSVSSLSDLRRMAAQADFAEVWLAYIAAMFLVDLGWGIFTTPNTPLFILKWTLILVVAAALKTLRNLSISTMDQAALMALLSTLTPGYIILAVPLTLILNELMQPILKRYGHAGAYPFLPTVFMVNLLLIFVILTGGIEAYLA
jgi:hypothetical protein